MLSIFASGEQAANSQEFTDFNDLASMSVLAKKASSEARSIVDSLIEKHQARIAQRQEHVQKQEQQSRWAAKI